MKSVAFEKEVRRFIRTCYLFGYKDEWIRNLQSKGSCPTLQGMTGIERIELNEIIRDELLKTSETVRREIEIAEIQVERNQGICPIGGHSD